MKKRLDQYDAFMIPVDQIYVDPDFNCREPFTLESVAELAESIKTHELQFPIIVQPYSWDGKTYRLVAGHRRFAAITAHLRWQEVPAVIREFETEFEAHKLNLIENLDRKDLNMLEEARAIKRLYPSHSVATVARILGRTEWWVRVRFKLLEMPDEVQQMAAATLIKAADIDMLARLDDKTDKLSVAKEVADRRVRNPRQRPVIEGTRYGGKEIETRTQNRIDQVICQMVERGVTGLPLRVASWCAGYITREDLEKDIQDYLEKNKSKRR